MYMESIRKKLKSYITEKWNYEILCDIFEVLDMEELKKIAVLYNISGDTRPEICNKLASILELKKREYRETVSKCTNTMDPITGTEVENIDPLEVITFNHAGKTFCFEIEGIHEHIEKGNIKNPYTNVPFDNDILQYIKSEYAKLKSIKGNKFDPYRYKTDTVVSALLNQLTNYIDYFPEILKQDFVDAHYIEMVLFLRELKVYNVNIQITHPLVINKVSVEQFKIDLIRKLIRNILENETQYTVLEVWESSISSGLFKLIREGNIEEIKNTDLRDKTDALTIAAGIGNIPVVRHLAEYVAISPDFFTFVGVIASNNKDLFDYLVDIVYEYYGMLIYNKDKNTLDNFYYDMEDINKSAAKLLKTAMKKDILPRVVEFLIKLDELQDHLNLLTAPIYSPRSVSPVITRQPSLINNYWPTYDAPPGSPTSPGGPGPVG